MVWWLADEGKDYEVENGTRILFFMPYWEESVGYYDFLTRGICVGNWEKYLKGEITLLAEIDMRELPEEWAMFVLNHEILHDVLHRTIGYYASRALDLFIFYRFENHGIAQGSEGI